MAYNFPSSPATGDTVTVNGRNFLYNGIGWIPSPVSSDTAPIYQTAILATDRLYGYRNGIGKIEVDYATIKSDIVSTYNVNTFAELRAVLESASTPPSVVINLTSDVTSDGLELVIKPTNINIRGGKIILPISSNLWFSPSANSVTYKILVESTITANDAGASIKVGSSTYSATLGVRVNAIVGLSTLAPVSISFVRVGASTVTATYNSLFNVEIIGNVALDPTQENTFNVWLPEYVVQRSITQGATYEGPYNIATVPLGYYVERMDLVCNNGAEGAGLVIKQGTVLVQQSIVQPNLSSTDTACRIRYTLPILGEASTILYVQFYRQCVALNDPELVLAEEVSPNSWINSTITFRTTLKKYV